MRYGGGLGDVAETSAAGSGSRECQTTTDALCLLFFFYVPGASKNLTIYHTIIQFLHNPAALDYNNNPYHIRLT